MQGRHVEMAGWHVKMQGKHVKMVGRGVEMQGKGDSSGFNRKKENISNKYYQITNFKIIYRYGCNKKSESWRYNSSKKTF